MSCIIRYFLFAAVLLTACKKTEIQIDQPKACIVMRTSFHGFTERKIVLKDAPVHFSSCSQGHDSYRWDFGDGNTSTDSLPLHYFRKPGNYNVKLIVGKKNTAFDTAYTTVHVALGTVSLPLFGQAQYSGDLIGMVELPDGGFIVLIRNTNGEYALVTLSEDLAIQKNIPFQSTYRLEDIQLTHDNNLLLIGTETIGALAGVIVKMNIKTETLWTKKLPSSTLAVSATKLADNGWIVSAQDDRNLVDNWGYSPRTTLYRLDQNGNILWGAYSPKMSYTLNCEIVPDGFIVAGGYYSYYTWFQLVIAKFSTTGELLWEQEITAGEAAYEVQMKTQRLPDNNLGVSMVNSQHRSLFIFSPTGQFLDKRYISDASNTVADFCITAGGNLTFIQSQSQVSSQPKTGAYITRTDLQGYLIGTTKYQPEKYISVNGSAFPTLWARRIFPLRKGGTLSFYLQKAWLDAPYDMLLLKVDDQGMPM